MKFNKPLYYCTECKTILATLDKLLFIEEKSTKGFCSETCIEDFYLPLIRHFESIELNMRRNLGIEDELINSNFSEKQLIDQVINSFDEIWKVSNELDEEIFTYIKNFIGFSGVVICKVYNGEASFVFLTTTTRSNQFLSEIRLGEKIKNNVIGNNSEDSDEENQAGEFSEEDFIFMQLLENKKSKLLADLLEKRKEDDISFEDFMLYENCFPETLETPDEVFESLDNEGDSFYVYIKSFIKETENYYYIISCLKRKDKEESPEVSVFPVLAFPTNDLNLYSEFRNGKRISAQLKN